MTVFLITIPQCALGASRSGCHFADKIPADHQHMEEATGTDENHSQMMRATDILTAAGTALAGRGDGCVLPHCSPLFTGAMAQLLTPDLGKIGVISARLHIVNQHIKPCQSAVKLAQGK